MNIVHDVVHQLIEFQLITMKRGILGIFGIFASLKFIR